MFWGPEYSRFRNPGQAFVSYTVCVCCIPEVATDGGDVGAHANGAAQGSRGGQDATEADRAVLLSRLDRPPGPCTVRGPGMYSAGSLLPAGASGLTSGLDDPEASPYSEGSADWAGLEAWELAPP